MAATSVEPVVVNVVGRVTFQGGNAFVLYDVRLGDEAWVMKVPRDVFGSESACAREWIYGRFAERLGLPVAELRQVVASHDTSHHMAEHPEGPVHTATALLELNGSVESWSELDPVDIARLLFWENATTVWSGDKVRARAPRDMFRCRTSPHAHGVVMLDYESLPTLWDAVLRAGEHKNAGITDDTRQVAGMLSEQLLLQAAEEARDALSDEHWEYITAGVDRFYTGNLHALRAAMRQRLEDTWVALMGVVSLREGSARG